MNDQNAMTARGLEENLKLVKAEEDQKQAIYDKTAKGIEAFIDRVFLTAKSIGDVFHQFLTQLLGSFVKWISHMLASWLTGVRGLSGAGGGGGGGILGSLLGGIFGIGGGGGNLAVAGTGAVAGAALGGGAALSLGGGATQAALTAGSTGALASGVFAQTAGSLGGGAIPAAAGGASGGALGKFAFGGYQARAPMLAGGLALGGAMLGAGVAVGMGTLASMPALLALTTIPGFGWIAAGIGALIGGIVGLFSRGKQKKKASALEAQYEKSANDLVNQYLQHQLDYESALDQLGQVLATGQQTLYNSGTGKWGGKAAGALAAAIQTDLAKVVEIEKERQSRLTAMGGMSVPEFAVGGYVGAGLNNGILAVLHPGKFVMQKSAVDSLGANFLSALNRAPRFADGGAVGGGKAAVQNIEVNLNVQAIDGQSVAQFFRRSRGFIVKEIKKAVWEGAF